MATTLLVGTRKGLFLVREDGGWQAEGPQLTGWEVFHATADPRDGSLYAATNSFVYGPTVHRSTDGGETWERAEEIGLPEESGLTLDKAWHVEPGHASEPDTLFLGGAPGALLRSDDRGRTWEAVRGLTEHPTREQWEPGAGGLCCHSIQIDPGDARRLVIAISAAGAFRSEDGGETWMPINKNVAADFRAEKYPELGQCVHKLLLHPGRPGRLWQQNHCGVYRSDDWGDTWERLDGNGLPSDFGFPIALDPADPDRAWVVPEEGAENRVSSDGRLGVYRTDDGGATWELESDGLPQQAWLAVLREGMSFDGDGVYVGAQSGAVWARRGDGWTEVVRHLPPVLSVEAAAL